MRPNSVSQGKKIKCPFCDNLITPYLTNKSKLRGYVIFDSPSPVDLARPITSSEAIQVCPKCKSEISTQEFRDAKQATKEAIDEEFATLGYILIVGGLVVGLLGLFITNSIGVGWNEQIPFDKQDQSTLGIFLTIGGGGAVLFGFIAIFVDSE